MEKTFSVKLLFQHISSPESMPNKTFEETINIIRAPKLEDVDRMVKEHFKDITYTNAFGEKTTIRLVMILDVFELVDDIDKALEFVEVYSHHIILDDEVCMDQRKIG